MADEPLAPAGGTAESQALYQVARRLAERCPPDLGAEIAITGSVARGLADRFSDIEIVCWNAEPPADEMCRRWLESLAADEIRFFPWEDPDGTRWATCRYGGTWIEIGWGRYGPVEAILDALVAARRADHGALQIAASLRDAVALRTSGQLAGWQERLGHYPDELQRRVIQNNTAVWSEPHAPLVRWALASRGLLMPLAMRLLWDMQNLWAVLHAINKVWEPDYKWTTPEALQLDLQPERLAERLNRVFSLEEPEGSIRTAFQLILDTLALVPPSIDVTAARASIEAALRSQEGRPF